MAYNPIYYSSMAHFDPEKLELGESQDYLRGLPELEHAIQDRNIEALLSGSEEERWLDLAPGSPMLQIKRATIVEPKVLEYMVARYRADRFKYRITLPMR